MLIIGRITKTIGLHQNADIKSPFKANKNKFVMPQPGHLYPVISLKIQGILSGVKRHTI